MARLSNAQTLLFYALATAGLNAATNSSQRCRTQPGDPAFPSTSQLAQFNSSIDGRLIPVVPSGKFCQSPEGGCSEAQWTDALFKDDIPGAMLQVNWEQNYASNPPSTCFLNTTVCGQGSVPVFGVNATSAAHIQAGVRFAQAHNLRVAVKASGHDYLGRSTAKNSLLLWTRHFQNITFHDTFKVGGKDQGSAVTVGSGVGCHILLQAAKAQGKMVVGPSSGTAVPAGGYVQGGGHALLPPMIGLGSDNVLEFEIVIADGSLITASEASHPDLFWALRGGGAGSWGVIISATFRTFPTFDAVFYGVVITVNSSEALAQIAPVHAAHIFDWDYFHVGHYFYVLNEPPTYTWTYTTVFPNTTVAIANASVAPFLNDVAPFAESISITAEINSINEVAGPTDDAGMEVILGSRLIPEDIYRGNLTIIGDTYRKILNSNAPAILGHMVAGGQVSKNAYINSAVNPKWRTAKTHLIVPLLWDDSTPANEVEALREDLTKNKVPILDALAGPGAGAYSNEADVREPHFQTTFFGPNYARLSAIKEAYDPHALFIVGAGVGSEKWDEEGLCRAD